MAVRLGIDTGGTFTDLIGIDDETGELVVAKTPSTPSRPVDAIMNAIDLSEAATDALEASASAPPSPPTRSCNGMGPRSSTSRPRGSRTSPTSSA